MPIFILLGVIISYEIRQESLQIATKKPYLCSKSLKVVEFGTNRKGMCDFLKFCGFEFLAIHGH